MAHTFIFWCISASIMIDNITLQVMLHVNALELVTFRRFFSNKLKLLSTYQNLILFTCNMSRDAMVHMTSGLQHQYVNKSTHFNMVKIRVWNFKMKAKVYTWTRYNSCHDSLALHVCHSWLLVHCNTMVRLMVTMTQIVTLISPIL